MMTAISTHEMVVMSSVNWKHVETEFWILENHVMMETSATEMVVMQIVYQSTVEMEQSTITEQKLVMMEIMPMKMVVTRIVKSRYVVME